MNSSERHIAAIQEIDNQRQQWERMHGSPSGGGGPVGGGIGNLAGWVTLFSMIGAVLGGILGRSLAGAILGAALLGGAMWAIGALGRSSSSGSVTRLSVILWTLAGALTGAIIGSLIGADSVRAANAALNWSIFGAILGGGFRLLRRARS